MVLAVTFVQELNFIELLFAIVLGYILVNVWQRVIDNFTFNVVKLNKESTYHTLIIALVATIIFFTFIFSFDSIFSNIVETNIAGGFIPPIPPS